MKKAGIVMLITGMVTAPVQAADWSDVRPGTFVGARLTIGGKTGRRPSAALTIAPTQDRISSSGMSSMRIGEGIALNLTPGAKPTLTLAGVRADTALGLQRDRDLDSDNKVGISTGGWVAIGVGSAALIFGGLYLAADHIADCDEGECD
jgi:hypothetical protein